LYTGYIRSTFRLHTVPVAAQSAACVFDSLSRIVPYSTLWSNFGGQYTFYLLTYLLRVFSAFCDETIHATEKVSEAVKLSVRNTTSQVLTSIQSTPTLSFTMHMRYRRT